ncbi:MAG: hypothetical protein NDI82_08990, partial [Anaeromyxobacteraceae bacterium]|nr:hypothetical protein [Anaeromyxobacteraceae bacterium]
MRRTAAWLLAVLLAVALQPGAARAHPVTVDGSAAEWGWRDAGFPSSSQVRRTPGGAGELIWVDAIGDARTDLASPEWDADILSFEVTGDAANLYLLVRRPTFMEYLPGVVQVQVAIDLDGVAGSGQEWLAGLADTRVSQAHRWEYLVQTRFGSGAPARLWSAAFSAVADLPAAEATDVEIAVPWSALGFSGPPAAPIWLTVATFRTGPSDDTLDLGGAAISNALDAVTDYGDPSQTVLNTWTEASDGVLDFALQAFFDPAGEVYAPLLVDRLVPIAGAAGEWLALRNAAPVPLDLGGYRVGDATRPEYGGAMGSLPAGLVLAPGAALTVARDGAAFLGAFSRAPDLEIPPGTLAGVPDLATFPAWSLTASFQLGDAGDTLLVLGPSDTILDVVPYGTGAWTGMVAAPAPAAGHVLVRRGAQDTDVGTADFLDAGAECASDAACGSPCLACVLGACAPQPAGTSCADGDVCNGAETCDAAGACQAGSPLVCDDGMVCNGVESCDPATGCMAGVAPVCADANPCTTDLCAEPAGCIHQALPSTASCSDGNPCNGAETCDGVGRCQPGAPLLCVDGRVCTTDRCDPAIGCVYENKAQATPCPDADLCDGTERCDSSGGCVDGPPLACDDASPCTTDGCDPATGCTYLNLPEATSCRDADACDGEERCDAAGRCVAGEPLTCTTSNPCL